jgi:hypothetical protein
MDDNWMMTDVKLYMSFDNINDPNYKKIWMNKWEIVDHKLNSVNAWNSCW